MSRKFLPVFFCTAILFLGFTSFAQQGAQQISSSLTRETRLLVFEQVWRTINDTYYDRHFRGVDWRALHDAYRPKAEAAKDSAELYRVLRQMIGKLGDAHTRIYSPEDGFDRFRPTGMTVGMVVRRVEGKPIVNWVEPGSEAARQGIAPGFVVQTVDGQRVEAVLARLRSEIGDSSTPTALDLQSYDRLFYGPRDTPVAVTFLDKGGKSRSATLPRRFTEFQRKVIPRQLAHNIGYIELTGFGPEIESDFERTMQKMRGTRGLVLDLRNNGGGFVTTVTKIASYFFAEETDLGEFVTRQGRSTRRRTERQGFLYREPLTILVSPRSASGSEIFAAAMQEQKRAQVIGVSPATCGCLLGVSRTVRLADGGKLNVSDTDYRTAFGRRIEGVGIKPDQQIEVTIDDLSASRDRALEAAVYQIVRTIAFGARSADIDFKIRIPGFFAAPGATSRNSPASQLKH